MNEQQIDASNRGAEFLAQTSDDERPCIRFPDGRLVYAYYDDDGALVASADTEGCDDPVTVRFVVNGYGVREIPANLPTWDEMSDRDKGAALMHVWKVEWEGEDEAVENYPARYLDDPALVRLLPEDASRHAYDVTDGYDEISGRLGPEEFKRLYNLALEASRG